MNFTNILKKKKEKKALLLNKLWLKDNKKAFFVVYLDNKNIDSIFIDALKILPWNFVIKTDKKIVLDAKNIIVTNNDIYDEWFDAIVSDGEEESIMKFLKMWVVPIVYKKHHISALLEEFNAQKVEWNAFIFENNQICDIYYAIIRYLENYKFPYDNKALVKNILSL